MGLLKDLIQNALELLKTAEAPAEKPVEARNEPPATASKAAENGWLANYPKWTATPIKETNNDSTDEYDSCSIFMQASDKQLEQYVKQLEEAGFVGDTQIQSKMIDGLMYYVDFSFIRLGDDCEIRYLVYK